MALSVSFLFSAINLQTASKDELICIKGIGDKKANAILKYRKSNKLKSADDLIGIKGFGKGIIANVKKGVKSVACGGKKSTKKTTKKATTKPKTSKKETQVKKTPSRTVEKKTSTPVKTDVKKVESKKVETKKTEKKTSSSEK